MPFFKSLHNILKAPEEDEVFNSSWMNSNELVLPPKAEWAYDRELNVEDIDIWEVLYEAEAGIGVYASWCPHAEFYLITTGFKSLQLGQTVNDRVWETFYGVNAQKKVFNRCKQLGITLTIYKNTYVKNDKMWLYI